MEKHANRRRRQRGFTLLEALCAMTLFSLIAAAMVTLSVASIRSTSFNRHNTMAAMIAQQEVEQLRGLEYVDVISRSSSTSVSGQNYVIASNVQTNVPGAGMKNVTTTVSWTGPEGAHSYVARTILTDITL
jgi:type II secretion system protein I